MTDHFDYAAEALFDEEGMFADHRDDPGGATMRGFSLRWAMRTIDKDEDGYQDADLDRDGDVDVDDIRGLHDLGKAKHLLRAYFWDEQGYGEIRDRGIATVALSMAFHMGPSMAHKIIQRALRACGHPSIRDDGILGPRTRLAMAATDPDMLMVGIRSERAGFCRALEMRNTALIRHGHQVHDFRSFLKGWLSRSYGVGP